MPSQEAATQTFKSFIKLPGGSETQKCFYPLRLDTYGCGCVHDCLYCYARSALAFRHLWEPERPRPADIAAIERVFEDAYERDGRSVIAKLLRTRMPVRLGGLTDCFGTNDLRDHVSIRALRILRRYQHPYLILTKGTILTRPEYLEVLDPTLAYVQVSVTTPYDELARVYEPGAPPTSKRLESAKILAREGYYVAARINPFMPLHADGFYSTLRYSGQPKGDSADFHYFDASLIDQIANAGCQTCIAGFVRLSGYNIRWIREQTGDNLERLFAPDTKHANTALHYSEAEKRYYYEWLQGLCARRGLAFSVCYDGDDAYETFRYLWANPMDCCNGLGNIPGFQRTYLAWPEMAEQWGERSKVVQPQ